MTEKTIKLPVAAPAEEQPAAIPELGTLPQGATEFMDAVREANQAAINVMSPFLDAHAAFHQVLGETLRYLELSAMYFERFNMYATNPQLLGIKPAAQEPTDGEA